MQQFESALAFGGAGVGDGGAIAGAWARAGAGVGAAAPEATPGVPAEPWLALRSQWLEQSARAAN
ncbi:MAG TPA: hypothetical protein VJU61_26550 [Polyangiaceae bacterium]|nr:hypothetical protein [Polyangiaceae bacterium]